MITGHDFIQSSSRIRRKEVAQAVPQTAAADGRGLVTGWSCGRFGYWSLDGLERANSRESLVGVDVDAVDLLVVGRGAWPGGRIEQDRQLQARKKGEKMFLQKENKVENSVQYKK